jgi:hypothetical protein
MEREGRMTRSIKAVVRDGRIEPEVPLDLPDGTRLVVSTEGAESREAGSPEAIEAWLLWSDTLEPLIFSAEEKAAWEPDRSERKAWELSRSDQHAERLARLWP